MMVTRMFLVLGMVVYTHALEAMVPRSAGSALTGVTALTWALSTREAWKEYTERGTSEGTYLPFDTEKKVPLEPCGVGAVGLLCVGATHCGIAPWLKQTSMKLRLLLVSRKLDRPYFDLAGIGEHRFDRFRCAQYFQGATHPHQAAMSDLQKGYASLLKVHRMLERKQIVQCSSYKEEELKIQRDAEWLGGMIRARMDFLARVC